MMTGARRLIRWIRLEMTRGAHLVWQCLNRNIILQKHPPVACLIKIWHPLKPTPKTQLTLPRLRNSILPVLNLLSIIFPTGVLPNEVQHQRSTQSWDVQNSRQYELGLTNIPSTFSTAFVIFSFSGPKTAFVSSMACFYMSQSTSSSVIISDLAAVLQIVNARTRNKVKTHHRNSQ